MADHRAIPFKQLHLLRHAQATDSAPGGAGDRHRPLTPAGRQAATALGRWMAAEPPELNALGVRWPEAGLCSAAVRTRQTAELMLAEGQHPVPLQVFSSLYQAGVEEALKYVSEIDEDVSTAVFIGHNPTVGQLVWELLSEGAPGRQRIERDGYPTCTLAVVDLAIETWADIAPETGTLCGMWSPPF